MPAALEEFEPELWQPVPRTVRATWDARCLTWALFLAGTIVPAVLLPLGFTIQHDFDELRSRGIETPGTIIERHPGGSKSSPSAHFRYHVGGVAYTFRRTISHAQYKNSAIGLRADITYLSDRPEVAELAVELAAHRFDSDAMLAGEFAALIAAVALPCWLYQWLQQHKAFRLARWGMPARTSRFEAELVRTKSKYGVYKPSHWRASYEFPAEGRTILGQGKIPYREDADWCAPGVQATVLYDPGDPDVNQLYPALESRCTIADEAAPTLPATS